MQSSIEQFRRYIHPVLRRYYTVSVQRDLLGDLSLVRCWGCLDHGLGAGVFTQLVGEDSIEQDIQVIHKRRLSHGYRLQ